MFQETRVLFSEKKSHSWNLSGLTLARSCAKHSLCVCSYELSTRRRRPGHHHLTPRLLSVEPEFSSVSLFPETCS